MTTRRPVHRVAVKVGLALLAMLHGAPLLAHDLWIEPATFQPQPGQPVGLRLRVGQALQGDPLPLVAARVRQFMVVDAAGRRSGVGAGHGAEPAGLLRVTAPGLHIVGYHSLASAVELAADKFDAYLKEEGLDAVIAARAARPASGAMVRERFSRCAKSLLNVGPPNPAQRDRRLGCALELVAEADPSTLPAGQPLPVRLTWGDAPLAGALVVAINKNQPADRQAVRSDADGRVQLTLGASGMWLVKAVHMVAAPAGSGAEWESTWASLTFEMPLQR